MADAPVGIWNLDGKTRSFRDKKGIKVSVIPEAVSIEGMGEKPRCLVIVTDTTGYIVESGRVCTVTPNSRAGGWDVKVKIRGTTLTFPLVI